MSDNIKYIYESPDKGRTVYRREFGKLQRELVKSHDEVVQHEKENSESTRNMAQ